MSKEHRPRRPTGDAHVYRYERILTASGVERASDEEASAGQDLIGTELFSAWFPKVDQIPFRLIW